jgi:hypothetical protein
MPKDRITEIKNEIKRILGLKKLHKNRVNKLLQEGVRNSNRTHGEIVVSKLENIDEFMFTWRKHFIDNNECKYLPKNWSVK